MKICESKPVICRASGQASADTLDNTCPCLTCDHEAPIVAGSYCLAGNMIDRNTGMNGTGVDENVTFTLNTVDRHAVAYDARNHCLNGNVSGTLQAKGEGGWSLNYINPVIQPLPEATGADTYNGTVTGEVAATLTKVNGVATSGPKVIQAGEKGSPDWIVRRLIPLECGRLQGFPDGWAEIAPLTSPQEFPFWREVYARDCEIKGKRPSRKIVQGGSTESDKPYKFEGKEYDSLDLSGMEKMTVQDLIDIQKNIGNELAAMSVMEMTTSFAQEMAVKATGKPVEFFKLMPRGKIKKVQAAVVKGMDNSENADEVKKQLESHTLKFAAPYTYEGSEKAELKGKTFDSIDLSGVGELNTMSESMAENRMAAGGFAPVNTHRNYLYCCIIASMGTGYPVDFFAGLPLCEAVKLRDAVNSDFFE